MSVTPTTAAIHSSTRYPQIDGLRGVAILLVLFWNIAAISHAAPGSALAYFAAANRISWSGVDLFFLLSGFLIGGIILDHRRSANFLSVFYLRRACRIFPIYYLSLIGFVVVAAILGGDSQAIRDNSGFRWLLVDQGIAGATSQDSNPIPLWSYFIYAQNFAMANQSAWGPGWLGVTWSLAVEEQFYLIFPLAIYFTRRSVTPALCILAIIAAPILRYWIGGLGSYCLLACRADSLAFGVLLAYALRLESVAEFLRKRSRWITVCAASGLLVLAAMIAIPNLFGTLKHTVLAGVFVLNLASVLLDPNGWPARICRSSVLGWFEQISYGIYLTHTVALGALHAATFGKAPSIENGSEAAVSLLALAACIAVSKASFHGIESLPIRFGRTFRYRTPTVPEPV